LNQEKRRGGKEQEEEPLVAGGGQRNRSSFRASFLEKLRAWPCLAPADFIGGTPRFIVFDLSCCRPRILSQVWVKFGAARNRIPGAFPGPSILLVGRLLPGGGE
jgi:hypothetical protein